MFNPNNLAIARKRRRLTCKDLATKVGLSPVTITRLEKGDNEPEKENVELIAEVLDFPVAFFYGDCDEQLTKDLVSFRSMKAMTAKERDSALSAGDLALFISDWVDKNFNLPDVLVPDLSEVDSPAVAASLLRDKWGLGNLPIGNLIKLLESKGVRVFSLSEDTKNVDAFSFWRKGIPFVFLNTFKTAERSRFDAAHELGHLVLHQNGENKGRDAEKEANLFASHFLIPEKDLIANIQYVSSLDSLVKAKKRWGVSLLALVYRLHKKGLITDWKYQDFCIQINRKYQKNEPEGMDREKSLLWEQVIRVLWKEGVSSEKIASTLNIPLSEFNDVVFGMFYAAEDARPKMATLSVVK